MKKQSKWELLKFAYDNFPKGTSITWNNVTGNLASGQYYIDVQGWVIDSSGNSLYDGEKWIEIIREVTDTAPIYRKSQEIGSVNINGFKFNIGILSNELYSQEIEDIHKALLSFRK